MMIKLTIQEVVIMKKPRFKNIALCVFCGSEIGIENYLRIFFNEIPEPISIHEDCLIRKMVKRGGVHRGHPTNRTQGSG